MLAFENQYILANNVGNGHAEHLIMIEFIKHFSLVFYVTAGWASTSCSPHTPYTSNSGIFFFFFFSSLPSCLLLLWEYTNGFDYIIAANFMSPTSIVTHHKQEWTADSIPTKVDLDPWEGFHTGTEGKDHRERKCTVHCERLSLDYEPLQQTTQSEKTSILDEAKVRLKSRTHIAPAWFIQSSGV